MTSMLIALHLGVLLHLAVAEPAQPPPFPFGMPPPPPPPFGPPSPPPPFGLPPLPPMVQFTSPSPKKPSDDGGFNSTKYVYDGTGRLARDILKLVKTPRQKFLGTHMYFLLESSTANALSEFIGKVEYAKENGAEECLANGEESAVKNFRRRLSEAVWSCEAGWKRNETFVNKTIELLDIVDGLDREANESLKGCKQGETCYDEFKKSPLAAKIEKQLTEIRRNQLIELRIMADQDHVKSLYSLFKCNTNLTDDLRKDIYTSIAKINICISSAGLVTSL